MPTGSVKFFNDAKGFGFIKTDDNGKDIFVHVNDTLEKIKENDQVTFDIGEGRKGPTAINVKLVK